MCADCWLRVRVGRAYLFRKRQMVLCTLMLMLAMAGLFADHALMQVPLWAAAWLVCLGLGTLPLWLGRRQIAHRVAAQSR